jgi:hypothetical protein
MKDPRLYSCNHYKYYLVYNGFNVIQQPPTTLLSDDYDERAAQVAAFVAAYKAKLVLNQKRAEDRAERSKLYNLIMVGEQETEEVGF